MPWFGIQSLACHGMARMACELLSASALWNLWPQASCWPPACYFDGPWALESFGQYRHLDTGTVPGIVGPWATLFYVHVSKPFSSCTSGAASSSSHSVVQPAAAASLRQPVAKPKAKAKVKGTNTKNSEGGATSSPSAAPAARVRVASVRDVRRSKQ